MHVAALPAFANTTGNHYNALLSGALQQLGVTVDEWSPTPGRQRDIDVVHVHWPEIPLNIPRRTHAAARTAQLLAGLATARARGARVVWTAHNLHSHLQRRPRTERAFWPAMDRLVDGWIALSAASVPAVLQTHPALRRRPHVVTPHGHYRDAYDDTMTRADARASLELPTHARVACFLGRIRPYKGVDELLEVFARIDDPDAFLLVAGRCDDAALAARLEQAARTDGRLRVRLDKVDDADLQRWLRAADVGVLPYVDVLHSGSAMLDLSFDLPVLAPRSGSLPELAAAVPDWLQLYDGRLSAGQLRAALHRPRPPGRPDLTPFDWLPIARQTLALYETVAGRRASP